MANRYKKTYAACFIGIVNQAVIANITAVLFVPFMNLYGFELWRLGLLVGINFGAQMAADLVLSLLIDRLPYRPMVLCATAIAAVGLVLFGLMPYLAAGNMFAGLVAATVVFAFSGGMLEVLISPIVDNVPDNTGGKGAVMSLMHSFYAWGQVFVIIVTTLYLFIAGAAHWNFIMFAWAAIPVAGFLMFLFVPLEKKVSDKAADRHARFNSFFLVALAAILLGGGSEIMMNQWTSAYLELSMGLSKMTADLLGMGLFAVFLGVGRALYAKLGGRFNLSKVLCFGALATFGLYLVAGLVPVAGVALVACVLCGFTASLLWPGTLVVVSERFPTAGVWLFAVLAVSGDIGGGAVPLAAGFIAEAVGLRMAFVICSAVPLLCFLCHLFLYKKSNPKKMLDRPEFRHE